MKKIGVIGIPGTWSTERLAACLQERAGFSFVMSMEEIEFDLTTGGASLAGTDLMALDALIVKKIGKSYSHHMLDRLALLGCLRDRGLRIFSDPGSIAKAVNRLTGTIALREAGIPIPDTVITENAESARAAVERFGRAVFKPLFTSKARGMQVIGRENGADAEIHTFKNSNNPVMYIQKMMDIRGKDLGFVFLGGRYIATYARVGVSDSWNTTTHFGGRYEPHRPDDALIDLAGRAQQVFNLDFTCVDIAETPDGPVVFEVSAFGGFRGLFKAWSIDAAKLYADYVLEKIADA